MKIKIEIIYRNIFVKIKKPKKLKKMKILN